MVDAYKNNHKTKKRILFDEDHQIELEIVDITQRDLHEDNPKNKGLLKNIYVRKHSLFSYYLSLPLHALIHFVFLSSFRRFTISTISY